jgi:hypothetical protein
MKLTLEEFEHLKYVIEDTLVDKESELRALAIVRRLFYETPPENEYGEIAP